MKQINVVFITVSILLLSAFPIIAHGKAPMRTLAGTVTKISDGDTIHLETPEQTILKVRLYGIDAPETPKINQHTGHVNKPGQPYGDEAWKALESKIMGKQVKLDILDIDKYRRMVGMIYFNGRNHYCPE